MSYANFGVRLRKSSSSYSISSWRELRWYLTTDEIKIIEEIDSKFQVNEFPEANEGVFKCVFIYIIHKYIYVECERIFDSLKAHYGTSFINSIFETIANYYILESNREKELWKFLKEQEDKINEKHKERERIVNNVISISYEKYYDEFKHKYGFTYQSPNKDIVNNYGNFLNNLANILQENGVPFNLMEPLEKSLDNYEDARYKERFKESFVKTIYTPKVSRILSDLLDNDLKDKYYELQVKYELKRFFLLGGISKELLLLDYVKYYGYEFLKRHLSEIKWDEFSKRIEYYQNGTNGIGYNWRQKYFTKYKEKEIYLIGLIEENHEYFQNEEIKKNKDLLDFYKRIGHDFEIERIKNLFDSPILSTVFDDFQVHDFIRDKKMYYEYIKSFAGPENEIRKILGFKEIGEGWISETKLFYMIKERFKEFRVIQHGKPKWLGKQHIDIFMPDLNIGIEYQGKQHVMPLAIFGGEEGFHENKKRDKKKKGLCLENNCQLFEVFPEDNFLEFIEKLKAYIEK